MFRECDRAYITEYYSMAQKLDGCQKIAALCVWYTSCIFQSISQRWITVKVCTVLLEGQFINIFISRMMDWRYINSKLNT